MQNSDKTKFFKINNNSEILEGIVSIIEDYPNIEKEYYIDRSTIKVEYSATKKIIKRIIILSNEVNMSVYFQECKNPDIKDFYFSWSPFGIISIKMIDIECEDNFLNNSIISLLKQKKFFFKNDYSNKYFFKLKFYQQADFLCCLIDDEELKFSLPKNFEEIFEKIYDLISNKNIIFNDYVFYPFKQILKKIKR